jgi:shikimate dehydrogenase
MRKACIIGHPVAHSRSPLLHGHWLFTLGLDGAYERADVTPQDLPGFIARMPELGFVGGNVTVPHKEAVFRLVDEVSERARAIGAVNTIWFEDGRLKADNTDGLGFLAHLDASVPGWQAGVGTALVLGAGGAARAVVHGLLERGVGRIVLVNRNRERAAGILAWDPGRLAVTGWEDASAALREADLLVNTTSLGMKGQPPLALDLAGAKPGLIVDDLVYVPLETGLLAAARGRGLRIVDGLGMLLHQAVPGFERWFGVRPQVTPALRELIVADIEGRVP